MNPKLDDFLSAFVQATEITLQELCQSKILSTRILTPSTLPKTPALVAGMIGITSSSLQGAMSVHFPKEVFLGLLNRMLGESMTELVPGLEDGASEITNIIFGNAKTKLNEMGFGIQMALPTLITGKKIESLGSNRPEKMLGVEFTLDVGSLWILFELNPKTKSEITPPKTKSTMDKNWNAEVLIEFVKAVRKTLEVQFSTSIEAGAPFKKNDQQTFSFDVGSVIGVTDQDFSGYFGMYYQSKTFLDLMNTLLGTEYTELNDEVQDGASEITNICFGVAKQILNEKGHQIQMALPYLIRGSEITSSTKTEGRSVIAVPLSTPNGKFWIEFGYKEN